MRFSAVLFDLDGTLLDTLADIAHSANRVLAELGYPTHDIDAYRQFVGEGLIVLFRKALPAEVDPDEVMASCAEGFRVAYGREWNVRTRPYDGIRELLDALTARQVEMAVLSNKPDAFTKQCVREYLPEYQFRLVLGQRDGIPRKPDPAGALEIIDAMGVPADEFLYLGDSAIDMKTAAAAGMHAVGALWGFRSLEELQQSGAKAVIHRPSELLDLLEG
ncbi:MAG: HAD family hydrolase [Planctomycetes bacterium]|nr:HAD family hydrolase [Planctomycetota bacterium]MBL7037329.1 HAD family hydrolase [Pirellulaceae bacterium]